MHLEHPTQNHKVDAVIALVEIAPQQHLFVADGLPFGFIQIGREDEVRLGIKADDPSLFPRLAAGQSQSLGVELGGHFCNALQLSGILQHGFRHIDILRNGGKQQVIAGGGGVLGDEDGIRTQPLPGQGQPLLHGLKNTQHHHKSHHRQQSDGNGQHRLASPPGNVFPDQHSHNGFFTFSFCSFAVFRGNTGNTTHFRKSIHFLYVYCNFV